jgi:ubiquinone/menaquinone biosynthesis C-methylase UbiE
MQDERKLTGAVARAAGRPATLEGDLAVDDAAKVTVRTSRNRGDARRTRLQYVAMPVLSPAEIRDVNVRYHDAAAAEYDAKWSIDFGALAKAQTRSKLEKALGGTAPRFAHALELGAGTGYFSLNLMADGVIGATTATDISEGMLSALRANAQRLGLAVETIRSDAEQLPFADQSFDLVIGHAMLHHLPDPGRAIAECFRVLAPGGTAVFVGEPSRTGDRLAEIPKRTAAALAPLWRRAIGAAKSTPADRSGGARSEEHALEGLVDVRTFTPQELSALARAAGFWQVTIRGEELLANWFGWTSRVLEASAVQSEIPWNWRRFACRGYLELQRVDRWLLEPHLPPSAFYNLMLCARRPDR